MTKYKTSCSSLRPGQLDRLVAKLNDFSPVKNEEDIKMPMLQEIVHETAKNSGWWEEPKPTTLNLIAHLHSEVSEIYDAYRKKNDANIKEEMADVAILLFSYAEEWDINLLEEILKKNEKNKTRSYRHGGKRC